MPTKPVQENSHFKSQLRVLLKDEIALGPGKADLLEAISITGSISAAGKKMGMSYRRTWLLVDTMNRCFKQPLVETVTGGSQGGGARVTPLGEQVLAEYRALQEQVVNVSKPFFKQLKAHLRHQPLPSQKDN